MVLDRNNTLNTNQGDSTEFLNPNQVINSMIELRIQLAELEQQILALQPAFFTACLALNTDKIAFERAIITRRLTPGQWAYSSDILEQEALFKQLKQQFQKAHEPTGGREVIWAIKLLLTLAKVYSTCPSVRSRAIDSTTVCTASEQRAVRTLHRQRLPTMLESERKPHTLSKQTTISASDDHTGPHSLVANRSDAQALRHNKQDRAAFADAEILEAASKPVVQVLPRLILIKQSIAME
jgi:hypothetical protein